MKRTWGTETSKYPEEKKSNEIPLVAASERGLALKPFISQGNVLGRTAIQGDSPVPEDELMVKTSRSGHEKS